MRTTIRFRKKIGVGRGGCGGRPGMAREHVKWVERMGRGDEDGSKH